MKESKISIVITIYNTPEKELRKCIESAINQTFKKIEIILVNDGSNEFTRSICEEYSNKDERIKLINEQNGGESVARNTGIDNASTSNITFIDSDDFIEYNMCERLFEYIEKNRDYDILIFNCFIEDNNKTTRNIFYTKNGKLTDDDIKQIQLQNIEKGVTKYYPKKTNISVPWAKVYNKEFIKSNNLRYPEGIIRMPDAIFNMYAFEKARNIYMCQEFLYHYVQNKFSICNRYSKDTIKYYESYMKYVSKYIEDYNKDQDFIDTYNIKAFTNIDKYMYNYFFHKDNKNNYLHIKKEFKNLLEQEKYQNVVNNVKPCYLSDYQKLILFFAKRQNIFMLKFSYKIKNLIKSF